MFKIAIRVTSLAFIVLIANILSGCSSPNAVQQPIEETVIDVVDISEQVQEIADAQVDYLSLSLKSEAPLKQQYQLLAAQQMNDQALFSAAFKLVEKIDYTLLPREYLFQYSLLKAELHSAYGNYQQALDSLEIISFVSKTKVGKPVFESVSNSLARLSQSQQIKRLMARGIYLRQLGYHVDAAYTFYLRLQNIAQAEDIEINQTLLWDSLNKLDNRAVQQLLVKHQHSDFKGWLELVQINQDNQGGIEHQLQRFEQWRVQNPVHSASTNPPAAMLALYQFKREQPKKVALMLPLTGLLSAAGIAIRDGFLATYYALLSQGYQVPELFIYDTATNPASERQLVDMSNLYQRSLDDQVDIIIGPLDRGRVKEMHQLSLQIPVLAMNSRGLLPSSQSQTSSLDTNAVATNIDSTDTQMDHHNKVIEFSLAVEDEIAQIANKMIQDGHKRVLALGSDNSWGNRAVTAFNNHWGKDQQNRGYWQRAIVNSGYLTQSRDYTALLGKLLSVDKSNERLRRLIGLTYQGLEYTARRRQDVDAIFLAASPTEARQIKPLLAFFFAQDLPVYSTSSIYSGIPNAKLDNDMNEVQFITMPWLVDDSDSIRQALIKHDQPSPSQMQFYAMGVDAYHLHQRLTQLKTANNSIYHGAVGTLSLNGSGQIIKNQTWATFARGEPRLLDTD